MPEQPDDPYVIDEPRTEPRTEPSTLEPGRESRESREGPDERPPLRRIIFWAVVALVVAVGVVLYFYFADAVPPVLRTDP